MSGLHLIELAAAQYGLHVPAGLRRAGGVPAGRRRARRDDCFGRLPGLLGLLARRTGDDGWSWAGDRRRLAHRSATATDRRLDLGSRATRGPHTRRRRASASTDVCAVTSPSPTPSPKPTPRAPSPRADTGRRRRRPRAARCPGGRARAPVADRPRRPQERRVTSSGVTRTPRPARRAPRRSPTTSSAPGERASSRCRIRRPARGRAARARRGRGAGCRRLGCALRRRRRGGCGRRTLHPAAWIAWATCAGIVTFTTTDPFYLGRSWWPRRGSSTRRGACPAPARARSARSRSAGLIAMTLRTALVFLGHGRTRRTWRTRRSRARGWPRC